MFFRTLSCTIFLMPHKCRLYLIQYLLCLIFVYFVLHTISYALDLCFYSMLCYHCINVCANIVTTLTVLNSSHLYITILPILSVSSLGRYCKINGSAALVW